MNVALVRTAMVDFFVTGAVSAAISYTTRQSLHIMYLAAYKFKVTWTEFKIGIALKIKSLG